MNSSIDKSKIEKLIEQVSGENDVKDEIYYNHIMNEIRFLKEFKKRDQIRMVIFY